MRYLVRNEMTVLSECAPRAKEVGARAPIMVREDTAELVKLGFMPEITYVIRGTTEKPEVLCLVGSAAGKSWVVIAMWILPEGRYIHESDWNQYLRAFAEEKRARKWSEEGLFSDPGLLGFVVGLLASLLAVLVYSPISPSWLQGLLSILFVIVVTFGTSFLCTRFTRSWRWKRDPMGRALDAMCAVA